MDVFVARQPIFDRARELYAYELLFRSDDEHNEFPTSETDSATTQVIANTLLTIGLQNVACGKKAFLNVDRDLLMGGLHSILPQETIVLEILESVEPSDELIAACRELSQQGYILALDDFVGHPRFEPLTQIASLIKVDMRNTTRPEQERMLQTYRPRGISMVAEKVETQEEFEWARTAGYDYFQGYFFARPTVLKGHQIPASKMNCLRLLREMQNTDLDYVQLQSIISQDVSFSYKLLRYVNSALFAGYEETHSISYSLARLGDDAIRHWVALVALPVLAKDKPGELVTHSLLRARFCESLAKLAGVAEHALGFLMGLFSLLDALIDVPLADALQQTGVGPAISGALLGTAEENDPLREIYILACQYEAGDWKAMSASALKLGIKPTEIGKAYSESTLWAQQAMHATARKADSRRHVRHVVQGSMQVLWEDSLGREKVTVAQLINVSVSGVQMQLTERLAVQTAVSCSAPKMGISGRGVVRYCNPSRGKYLIGLEFTNGTGWREPK
jgi:EAL and modified HD-GYP domain-containing signal transduction protein